MCRSDIKFSENATNAELVLLVGGVDVVLLPVLDDDGVTHWFVEGQLGGLPATIEGNDLRGGSAAGRNTHLVL